MEYINKILEWPIIVQGALGSALFWLILIIGQKISTSAGGRLGKFNKTLLQHRISQEYISRKYFWAKDDDRQCLGFLTCIYFGLIYGMRGLVWIALGLVFREIIPTFALVGYIGAVYYFIRAANWIRPFEDDLMMTNGCYPKSASLSYRI